MAPPARFLVCLREPTLLPGIVLWVLLGIAWMGYRLGLTGAFLFDDWSNLEVLGHFGRIDTCHKLISYLLSGFASPLGRPFAMASFLLDADTWPADPMRFKQTNVLIHLLNGVLLCLLIFHLLRARLVEPGRAAWTAVLASGMWLLHPYFVSTTLYVVQRMAQLAANFTLAAILSYMAGRKALLSGRPISGQLWLWGGVMGFWLLGVLSKENAALLPLFLLLLDATVLRELPFPQTLGFRVWRSVGVFLPTAALSWMLASKLPALAWGESYGRPFTLWERLLTEGRILWMYLSHLFIPRAYTSGLFNDAIQVSHGLLTPPTTLLAWIGLGMLAWLAVRLRRQHPLVSLALGFYLIGHLVESTLIPLELAFEHRNYLPAAFLFLPLAWFLTASRNIRLRASCAAGILVLLGTMTAIHARLWGKPFLQALVWAERNPDSVRAQIHLAQHWMETENFKAARDLIERVSDQHPDDLAAQVARFGIRCRMDAIGARDIETMAHLFYIADGNSTVIRHQLEQVLAILESDACPSARSDTLSRLIETGLQGKAAALGPWRQLLLNHKAQAALRAGEVSTALALLLKSLSANPNEEATLSAAALLATHSAYREALILLQSAPTPPPPSLRDIGSLRRYWLLHSGYYQREREALEAHIRQDAKLAQR